MKYYIIAGEPSGDLHGSNLMKAIVKLDSNANFQFWGGDHMLNVDRNIVTHIRETSIMGFVEVVKHFLRIRAFFAKAKSSLLDFNPDVLVLIDYPGFNLRMAKWAKKKGFKTVYYISPQLWAWKKGRIKTVKKFIDRMMVILPFEAAFYQENGVKVDFVGHPLLPVIQSFIKNNPIAKSTSSNKKILAILPGSRRQEIKKLLPELVAASLEFTSEYRLCIALAPNIEKSFYESLLGVNMEKVAFIENGTYHLLAQADLALVTSGTATLETALFGVPQVVCYKTSSINYEIGKRLVDLEFISLVNLISGKKVVPELIQDQVNTQQIVDALNEVRKNAEHIKKGYSHLHQLLRTERLPHDQAAKIIVETAHLD